MFKSLEFFNFGPSFRNWIKLLYISPIGIVKNNGHMSEPFIISRGVRQGCPVSALIFTSWYPWKISREIQLSGKNTGYSNIVKEHIKTLYNDIILWQLLRTLFCSTLKPLIFTCPVFSKLEFFFRRVVFHGKFTC